MHPHVVQFSWLYKTMQATGREEGKRKDMKFSPCPLARGIVLIAQIATYEWPHHRNFRSKLSRMMERCHQWVRFDSREPDKWSAQILTSFRFHFHSYWWKLVNICTFLSTLTWQKVNERWGRRSGGFLINDDNWWTKLFLRVSEQLLSSLPPMITVSWNFRFFPEPFQKGRYH